jgi:hypothetical protein
LSCKPVSLNWFESRFISFQFRKSNKKTAAFFCQRFRHLHTGYRIGSQSFSFRVISTCVKLASPSCLQALIASLTDSVQSIPPSTQRQQDFRIFLTCPHDLFPYTLANPASSAISSVFPLSKISMTSLPTTPGPPLPSPSLRISQPSILDPRPPPAQAADHGFTPVRPSAATQELLAERSEEGRKTQRGLAALGRSQESVESKERHKLLCGKMLQWPRIKIEHGRQRFAGLWYGEGNQQDRVSPWTNRPLRRKKHPTPSRSLALPLCEMCTGCCPNRIWRTRDPIPA